MHNQTRGFYGGRPQPNGMGVNPFQMPLTGGIPTGYRVPMGGVSTTTLATNESHTHQHPHMSSPPLIVQQQIPPQQMIMMNYLEDILNQTRQTNEHMAAIRNDIQQLRHEIVTLTGTVGGNQRTIENIQQTFNTFFGIDVTTTQNAAPTSNPISNNTNNHSQPEPPTRIISSQINNAAKEHLFR